MRFALLFVLCGCASAPPEAPRSAAAPRVVAEATAGSAVAEPADPTPAPAPAQAACRAEEPSGMYGMCGMLAALSEPPDIAEASAHFEATGALLEARCYSQAGAEYLIGASFLRRAATHGDSEVVYNRRVAYANAVNLLLSVDKVEEARAALSAAALDDPDMAAELRQAATELPSPMRCSLPRVL